jgi:hypothetical protein
MTNPASPSRPVGRESEAHAAKPGDASAKKTPNTDMQADDAGTADSGVDESTQGSSVEPALKQTSKTGNETGGAR